ncbi:MAG: c-type cytochrome [Bryobacterales bacterium]|nr:c-type cytochrome [Bryobacterales bacterium]
MRLLLLWVSLVACAADDFDNIRLPDTAADLARGKKLYLGSCTYCHGPTGDGGKGADLSRRDLVRAKTDGDLVRVIEIGVPGTEMPSAWHMTRREVTQVAAFVRSLARVENSGTVPGDAARGKALYARHGCSNCHTLKQGDLYTGGYMGPDLSSIGLKRNAAHLRRSLIEPAETLPDDFVPIKVVTKAGKSIEGRRTHEDTFALVVRDFAGNNHSLLKSDLQSAVLDAKRSPMPGYKDKLSAAELDDLVAYLVSLKEPL